MAKEITFRSPDDKRNPERFALKALFENPSPDDILEVHIEWDEEVVGANIPIVVIKAAK